MPRPRLDRQIPLTELHVHLGAAVTPAIMWGIAHAQGIRLPTKDYWAFRNLITARRRRSFQAYLDLFYWTELIQSSPTAVERSVYEVIGGAYRKNNITRLELRFNPMKRNRGGEQDLDHIIAAAVRGMDRAVLEYPQVRAGLIFCLDRAFSRELNEIIAAKAVAWRDRGVVAVDIAGPNVDGFRFADYREVFAHCRRAGLGVTVHAGETGGPDEVRDAVEALDPERIGHGVKSAYDPRVMAMLRERGIVLEVCPTSNLNTRVVRDLAEMRDILRRLIDHEVAFALSTDGPEMLRSYLRDEMTMLLRHEILSLDEVNAAVDTAHRASFVDPAPPIPLDREPIQAANMHAAMPVEIEV
jgi:adenosine deaminase